MDGLNKEYDENYARLILERVFNVIVYCRTPDPPDLFSDTLDIGVEVTRAEEQKQGQINTVFQTKKKDVALKRAENIISKNEDSMGLKIDGATQTIYQLNIYSETDREKNCDIVVRCINKKIKKMGNTNKKYPLYSSNQLFIFSSILLFSFDIDRVIQKYDKDKQPNFDTIYFFINPTIVIWEKGIKREIEIDKIKLEKIQDDALKISSKK